MTKFVNFLDKRKRSHDEEYMEIALKEAEVSKSNGESARGTVIVLPNSYVSAGQTIFTEHDPLGYSEINALKKAVKSTNSLKEAVLYSTSEPCALCAIAAHEYGVREIIFGSYDKVNGFMSSGKNVIPESLVSLGGILIEECCNV